MTTLNGTMPSLNGAAVATPGAPPLPDENGEDGQGSLLDKITPAHIAALIRGGYKKLEWLRQRRRQAYETLAGPHYGPDKQPTEGRTEQATFQPVNLTAQQIRTLLPYLAPEQWTSDVSSSSSQAEFEADMVRRGLDQDQDRLDLPEKYQAAVIDAVLSGFTIHKVGVGAATDMTVIQDKEYDLGELYEEPVDLDDYVCDPVARRYDDRLFEGIRLQLNRFSTLNQRIYGRDLDEMEPGEYRHPALATRDEANEIIGDLQRRPNGGTSSGGTERVSDLSGQSQMGEGMGGPLVEEVVIWEIYLYLDGECWVLAVPGSDSGEVAPGGDKFLMFQKCPCGRRGALRRLTLFNLPNNIVPLSLDAMQKELAVVADLLANKIIRQTLRTKQNTIYRANSKDEADTLRLADEDEFIQGEPTDFETVKTGGLIQELIPSLDLVQNLWQDRVGQLGLAAGQNVDSPANKTATAFSGLMGRAMGWIQFLQGRVAKFATENLRLRAFYRLNDPGLKWVLPVKLPNGATHDYAYTADTRTVQYQDLTFKIHANPAPVQDPTVRLKALIEILTSVVPSVLQVCAMMGADPRPWLRMIGRNSNLPELDSLIPDPQRLMEQMAIGAMTGQGGPGGPGAMGGMGGPPMMGQMLPPPPGGQRPPAQGQGGGSGPAGPPPGGQPMAGAMPQRMAG